MKRGLVLGVLVVLLLCNTINVFAYQHRPWWRYPQIATIQGRITLFLYTSRSGWIKDLFGVNNPTEAQREKLIKNKYGR